MTETPKPCPFCGSPPEVYPKRPEIEGDAFGQVRCENGGCPANPVVNDGERAADTRGSEAYKQAAIKRWNRRAPPSDADAYGTRRTTMLSTRSVIGATERIQEAVQAVDDDARLVTVRIDDLSTIMEFATALMEAAGSPASSE